MQTITRQNSKKVCWLTTTWLLLLFTAFLLGDGAVEAGSYDYYYGGDRGGKKGGGGKKGDDGGKGKGKGGGKKGGGKGEEELVCPEPDDALAAETFFAVNCQPLSFTDGMNFDVVCDEGDDDDDDDDDDDEEIEPEDDDDTDLQVFPAEFWIEYNDGSDDIEPFSDSENERINPVISEGYNEVLGCFEQLYLPRVEMTETRVVELDEVLLRRRRRNLQRTSTGTSSLYQKYQSPSGRSRGTRSGNAIKNDNRVRKRKLTGKGGKGCEKVEVAPSVDDYNETLLRALRQMGFSQLQIVSATGEFPLIDTDGDGIFDIDTRFNGEDFDDDDEEEEEMETRSSTASFSTYLRNP